MPPESNNMESLLAKEEVEQITNNEEEEAPTTAATTATIATIATTNIQPPTNKSKNINPFLIYTFLSFSSRSLWNQSVLSAFVYLLKSNDPKFVGILTCIMGLSQLLISFPAGILADKYRRDVVLKASSVVGVIAVILTITASQLQSFVFLGIGLSFWGVFWGISFTSGDALFADSMCDGERSKYFTQRMIFIFLGNSTGPLVALIMFSSIGNEWTIGECQFVLAAGQLLSIPSFLVLCFLSDDYSVPSTTTTTSLENSNSDSNSNSSNIENIQTNDHEIVQQDTNRPSQNENDSNTSNDLETPLLSRNALDDFDEHPNANSRNDEDNENTDQKHFCLIPQSRFIPVMITVADITNGLASGMSIRYFPIFFLDNLLLSPRLVQALFLSSTLGMAVFGQIAQKLSEKIGRLPVTIIARWIGMSLMIAMVATYQLNAPVWVVSMVWALRTAIMNSTGALTRSILMDNVPTQERAKWSALESVNFAGWSGSAAFGGFLVDWAGIEINFYVTAGISFLATIPLLGLLGKVGKG